MRYSERNRSFQRNLSSHIAVDVTAATRRSCAFVGSFLAVGGAERAIRTDDAGAGLVFAFAFGGCHGGLLFSVDLSTRAGRNAA